MKFKEYFEDVLNQNKTKLQSAESEELELLRKLEQIRKKQSLYKKNINEIEQKLKAETIKLNKELFDDVKKINKDINKDNIETPLKKEVKTPEIEVKEVDNFLFGDPDFFKLEKKVINKNQTVVIDKEYEDLVLSEDQAFETNKLRWNFEYEDSRTLNITDVEIKQDKLNPDEITEEFGLLFNYLLANASGSNISMNIELNHLFDAIVDMNAVNNENKTQVIETYKSLVEFFESDETADAIVSPQSTKEPQESETEADNDVDYWEIYE